MRESPRSRIANVVRSLRLKRAWTQAELAEKLSICQSQLSRIEKGDRSFSAEQLLLIMQLFCASPALFADQPPDRLSRLQNALARLGARHLHESDLVLPDSLSDDAEKIIAEALASGEPRLTTALAPVLVSCIEQLRLARLHLDLCRAGLDRRLPWLCQNAILAIDSELITGGSRDWQDDALRAALVIDLFLGSLTPPADLASAAWDVLDAGIRSKETANMVIQSASVPSRRWRIVTSLAPEDFARALRDTRITSQPDSQ